MKNNVLLYYYILLFTFSGKAIKSEFILFERKWILGYKMTIYSMETIVRAWIENKTVVCSNLALNKAK